MRHYRLTNRARRVEAKDYAIVASILEFVNSVYVDTPLKDAELSESSDVWFILSLAAETSYKVFKEEIVRAGRAPSGVIENEHDDLVVAALTLIRHFFLDIFAADTASKRVRDTSVIIKKYVCA